MNQYENCTFMIDYQLKKEVYPILKELNISPMTLINSLFLEIIKTRKVPFESRFETRLPIDSSKLSDKEIMELIQDGINDVKNGRMYTIEELKKILEDNLGL